MRVPWKRRWATAPVLFTRCLRREGVFTWHANNLWQFIFFIISSWGRIGLIMCLHPSNCLLYLSLKTCFFSVPVSTTERWDASSVFCCALIEGNLFTYQTNVTNKHAFNQTRGHITEKINCSTSPKFEGQEKYNYKRYFLNSWLFSCHISDLIP